MLILDDDVIAMVDEVQRRTGLVSKALVVEYVLERLLVDLGIDISAQCVLDDPMDYFLNNLEATYGLD